MFPHGERGIRLFQLFGIQVSLHWSWFLAAAYQIDRAKGSYHAPIYAVVEYLALFGIVLMHEFGHALACRQTGGQSERIILWPLGGVAYVNPPARPGAHLWSIAAGPLVNMLLLPVLFVAYYYAHHGPVDLTNDQIRCVEAVNVINLVLLVFNMLPIYPLDGGQILQSLLWFWVGRTKSLMIAAGLGLAACPLLVGFVDRKYWNVWTGILVLYLGANCWRGFQVARDMWRYEKDSGMRL